VLYYGCLPLASATIAATFQAPGALRHHGLTIKQANRPIELKTEGVFPRFHDAVCTNVRFYHQRRLSFDAVLAALPGVRAAARQTGDPKWKHLLEACRPHDDDVAAQMLDADGESCHSHVATLLLASAFVLSNWSRYDPIGWEQALSGDLSGDSFVYVTALKRIECDFPRWVLGFLAGVRYQSPRLLVQREEPTDAEAGDVWMGEGAPFGVPKGNWLAKALRLLRLMR
jgi:hypothetical protein